MLMFAMIFLMMLASAMYLQEKIHARSVVIKRANNIIKNKEINNSSKLEKTHVKKKNYVEKYNLPLLTKLVERMIYFSKLSPKKGYAIGIMFSLINFLFMFIITIKFTNLIYSLVLSALFLVCCISFFIYRRIAKLQKQIKVLLPTAFEIIISNLKSGMPMSESFQQIGQSKLYPLDRIFQDIERNMSLGMTSPEAIRVQSEQLCIKEFDFFHAALSLQYETGGNLIKVLTVIKNNMRSKQIMEGKISAITSEGRFSMLIVGSLPMLVAAAICFLNPKYYYSVLYTTQFHYSMLASVVLLILAYASMNFIIKIRI